MGALTPTTLRRESMGSLTMFIANFAAVTSGAAGDTWATGLGKNIISAWAAGTTGGSAGIAVSFANGTVTMCPGVGASEVNLFVLATA